MRKYRKLLISALLVVGIAALALFLYRRSAGAPELAELLAEGDRLAYVNLKPIRLFVDLNKSRPAQLESNYQQFVDQTGIQFERDLDEAAMSWQDPANGRDSRAVGSSTVFQGRFDPTKLRGYLQKVSSQTETYRDLTIYSIPNEDHTLRACLLDGSRVAVTTMASSEAMHGIIDRLHGSAAAPSLLPDYYKRVPLGSLAWMIDRIPANSDAAQLPGGLSFGFLENTVAVVSLRYNGALLLRADVVAQSDAGARKVVDSANTFLVVERSISHSLGAKGNDPDLKAALNSIQVEQKENAAIFTAEFSERFLKKILSETQLDIPALAPSPSPAPEATPPAKVRKR